MIYFGIRIILDYNFEYENLLEIIKHNFYNLKCILSERGEYKAIHIYFKEDNYHFRWELQIWNKKDENRNLISHKKYKQDYIKWEKETKGGNNR